ncbi:uncharacterized protein V1516DRAFT_670881 [Lipomyces oligophaga]|uniref:uncharacterized protein n=1 Tax=Lipomyces oligophaga TaxID=45792 RepID=UPI0034CF6C40
MNRTTFRLLIRIQRPRVVKFEINAKVGVRGLVDRAQLQRSLPSSEYVDRLGGRMNPRVTAGEMMRDVTKLLALSSEALKSQSPLNHEKLKSAFPKDAEGRRLASYMRILERAQVEDKPPIPRRFARFLAPRGGLPVTDEARKTRMLVSSILRKAATLLGNNYAMAVHCGSLLKRQAQEKSGLKAVAKARALIGKLRDTNLPAAFYICGVMYQSSGNYDLAKSEFQKCIASAQAHVDTDPKTEKKDYDYDRDIDFGFLFRAHFHLGQIAELQNDLATARSYYIQVLQMRRVSEEFVLYIDRNISEFFQAEADIEQDFDSLEYYTRRLGRYASDSRVYKLATAYRQIEDESVFAHKTEFIEDILDPHSTLLSMDLASE